MKSLFRLGLIVNPIAGMGGKVGLHGTDGNLLEKARNLGATPISRERSLRALRRLQDVAGEIEIFAADGEMGYSLATELGFSSSKIERSEALKGLSHKLRATFAKDTRETAALMLARGVDLILFGGGDGTARDIHSVIGEFVPTLGIPTGVKMRSGVFATNPETAGDLARAFILHPKGFPIREVEILDIAEEIDGEDWPPTVLFGKAKSPYSQLSLQAAKSSSHSSSESGISSLCAALANTLREDSLYLYGPGTTTKMILAGVGEAGSTTGVDASLGKVVIGRDLSEQQILELLSTYSNATLFLGVIGGQGFLLGRGNQQISAAVVERLNFENIVLLASAEKIANLSPPVLQVDLGDQCAESALEGYRKVHVAPGRSVICRVITPQRNEVSHVAV
jgi:predicted polyphosphate/ATP-dependent NAD kinase